MADKKTGKEKAKGFFAEFKAFALKGNVMDLAVGVIIGAAFQNIVTALTNSFITPLIALIMGGAQTDENGRIVIGGTFEVNGVTFDYGAFISAIVNFLIMAIILFLLVKGMNKLMSIGNKKKEAAAAAKAAEEKAAAEKAAAEAAAKAAEPTKEELLLAEIRDLLKAKK